MNNKIYINGQNGDKMVLFTDLFIAVGKWCGVGTPFEIPDKIRRILE